MRTDRGARQLTTVSPPSFVKAKDAFEATRHFGVLVWMMGEEHTCAGCAERRGSLPAFTVRDHDVVGYVLCDTCAGPVDAGKGTTADTPADVAARVSERIAANNVWQMPLPDEGP